MWHNIPETSVRTEPYFQISSFAFSLLDNSSPLREMSFTNKFMTSISAWWFCVGVRGVHNFTKQHKMKQIPDDCAVSQAACCSWEWHLGFASGLLCHSGKSLSSEPVRMQLGAWRYWKLFRKKIPLFLVYLSALLHFALLLPFVQLHEDRWEVAMLKK